MLFPIQFAHLKSRDPVTYGIMKFGGHYCEEKIPCTHYSIITIAAIYLSTNSFGSSPFFANDTIGKRDLYSEIKREGLQPELEAFLKEEVNQYMYLNFGSVFETTRYDSVSTSSAIINENGRVFIVQSKGDSFDGKAHNYMGGIMSYFNDKTLDSKYKVDKVILVSEDFEILKESKTIKL